MSAPEFGSVPYPGDQAGASGFAELRATLGELAAPDLSQSGRRGLLRRLARQLPRPGRPIAPVRWLVDSVSRIAPQIPVRDLPTLQRHHGLDGPDLADRLLRNAARATAGIGAASGGLAAVQWSVPPTLLSAPVLLSIETVAVVAVELKLLGELHAVYRVPLPARGTQRAWALVRAWTHQRGIDPFLSGGVGAALRPAARRELADRLTRRLGRNLPTLAPLLAGAGAAAYVNRRVTLALGRRVRDDLARMTVSPSAPA